MIREVILKRVDSQQPVYWIFYLLLFVFGLWLFLLLSDKVFSDKHYIKQDSVPLSKTIAINDVIIYSFLEDGSIVNSGDSIGIKSPKDSWEIVNSIEALIKGETNPGNLRDKINGLHSGIDSIDNQLDELEKELKNSYLGSIIESSPLEHEVSLVQRIDNSKKIEDAEKSLRDLQSKYAKKKTTIDALIAASNKLRALREENGKSVTIKKLVREKKAHPVVIEEKTLNDNTKANIASLLNYIREWKKGQMIYAPVSGKLKSSKKNKQTNYSIQQTNETIFYYLDQTTSMANDTIYGNIVFRNSTNFPGIAIKDTQINKYIIVDQNAILADHFRYNENARLVFKQTGHSYYAKIKDLLCYK